ncbi:S9 family peptidase [Frateuria sp. MAH-13]|uniref:S9 family peptidase n=1 Tax=Frateuria flava TaxID=2821489 RepID=A0ABS4DNB9_9GAMM|nr:alpha/beta fold hydrolase [Frateuria flava]MBP1474526.1 S9 family peptidase [Frateuria flava]
MKALFAACGLLLVALCGCSRQSETPVVAIRHVADPSPFLSQTDCFAPWPTYDAWMDRIKARNAWWKPKILLLPFLFPREDFERGQQQLDCSAITYESDGLTIYGWMAVPKGKPGSKFPVLIYNRGGNGSFGALEFPLLLSKVFPYAENGFLVLASQYRGMPETDPERFGTDHFGGDDVRDVTRLIELARRLPDADPHEIFMLGASRGGMMTFMAARRTRDIKAVAVISGVSDLESELQFRPEMEQVYRERIPGYPADKARVLAERSVLAWAQDLPADMPVLLLHGDKDERVSPANGTRLHQRLDQLQRPNKLIVYPGDDHFLSHHKKEAVEEVVRWFRAAMAKDAAVVSPDGASHQGTR